MTTATADAQSTPKAAETLPVLTPEQMAEVFYKPSAPAADPSKEQTPAPISETGSPVTPDKASTASTEQAEAKPAKGADGKVKDGTEKEKPAEDGHAAAARRLGKEKQELQLQLQAEMEQRKILEAKLNGTYQEPQKPSEDQIRFEENLKVRETASRNVANERYGEETVRKLVYEPDGAFKTLTKTRPGLGLDVMKHDQPVLAAIYLVNRLKFEEKWGEDPDQWEAKLTDAIRPKLMDEFKQQAETSLKGNPPPSLTEARGAGGAGRETVKELSASDILYGKAKG
jgi:hypothetical protein